jgi:hypothetical protein
MDALDRLELVDKDEFDPEAYIRELSRGLTEMQP